MGGTQAIPIVTYFIPIPAPHSPVIALLPQSSGTPPGPVLHVSTSRILPKAELPPPTPTPTGCQTCLLE